MSARVRANMCVSTSSAASVDVTKPAYYLFQDS
jgi:hypothetical protein